MLYRSQISSLRLLCFRCRFLAVPNIHFRKLVVSCDRQAASCSFSVLSLLFLGCSTLGSVGVDAAFCEVISASTGKAENAPSVGY